MQDFLLKQALFDAYLQLLRASEAISHGREAHIESQADHKLAMRDIAASLHDVLRLNLKSGRVVNLLEIASEVALVVVLPLDEA